MNLENCKYIRLWQASATLDSTKKNCCQLITDGEELKNRSFSRRSQQCSSSFCCYQGQCINALSEAELLMAWSYLWLRI